MSLFDVHRYWTMSESSECFVCFETLQTEDEWVTCSQCHRREHHACWVRHIKYGLKCPICRHPHQLRVDFTELTHPTFYHPSVQHHTYPFHPNQPITHDQPIQKCSSMKQMLELFIFQSVPCVQINRIKHQTRTHSSVLLRLSSHHQRHQTKLQQEQACLETFNCHSLAVKRQQQRRRIELGTMVRRFFLCCAIIFFPGGINSVDTIIFRDTGQEWLLNTSILILKFFIWWVYLLLLECARERCFGSLDTFILASGIRQHYLDFVLYAMIDGLLQVSIWVINYHTKSLTLKRALSFTITALTILFVLFVLKRRSVQPNERLWSINIMNERSSQLLFRVFGVEYNVMSPV